jgi:sporulation protein YlmC with PRC-barrel domain
VGSRAITEEKKINGHAPQTTTSVNKSETATQIAASKVSGTSVFNPQGETLGTIHDVMLNKRSGQVNYAVLSFGRFLGFGEKYHPVPWKTLTYDERYGGYVIDLSKRQLVCPPAYTIFETPDWTTDVYGSSIDKYYDGVPRI